MSHAPQGLNRREQDVGVRLALFPGVVAEAGIGPNAPKRVHGLRQDFLAMCHEQHAPEFGPGAVEGCQPGLPKPRCQHDKAGTIPLLARGFECRKSFLLNPVRDYHGGRFAHRVRSLCPGQPERDQFAAPLVLRYPLVRQNRCRRVDEELFEPLRDVFEGRRVRGGHDPVVPLGIVAERGLADVRAAHERYAVTAPVADDVRLRVKGAAGARLKDPAVDSPAGSCFDLEQPAQRGGVGRVQVVPGEIPDTSAAAEDVLEVGVELCEAREHSERDGDVDRGGTCEMPSQVRQEWILEAADKRSAMRYAHPLGPVGLGVTIAPLARNDVVYAASRIGHVARVPWNDVHMEVEHRLSGRQADVDADVEAIGPVRPSIALRATSTARMSASCSSVVASNQAATCLVGTSSACPDDTGKASHSPVASLAR